MKNYTNHRHGDFHVTTKNGDNNEQGYKVWSAFCVHCSKKITLTTQQLSANRHLQCECALKDRRFHDGIKLTDTFGKLTVTSTSDEGFVCLCDCGEIVVCSAYELIYHIRSCGCAIVKDGGYLDGEGYRYIYKPDHPRTSRHGYVREHIVVMEEKIGRDIVLGEAVHHINGTKDDNRPENLWLFSDNTIHLRFHYLLRKQDRGLLNEFPTIMKEHYTDVMEVLQ